MTPLESFTSDHRALIDQVGAAAGLAEPVAVAPGYLEWPLFKAARKGPLIPVDGVLVRDWTWNPHGPGVVLGARVFEIAGVRFAAVCFTMNDFDNDYAYYFLLVARQDYRRLYRIARCLQKTAEPPAFAPILLEEQRATLWKNSIGFLESDRLPLVEAYGGRPRRGILLTGAPGNGKTMALRWIWEACRDRGWEYRIVTPNSYRRARQSCDPEASVQALFSVQRRGVIFFDDMDLALRDRDKAEETEDQAVFLTALDGLRVKEGVVYIFTTNCALELIDKAFQRPGRIDVVLHFAKPDADLRRQLLERWHADIRAHLDLDAACQDTAAYSFAEIEELKNLLIMRFLDTGAWEWAWAMRQFAFNRDEFTARRRQVGFNLEAFANGLAVED